jgi:hypothetical protein
MKQQFIVTHTIRQIEIFALLDSWVTSTPSVKTLCPRKTRFSLYFRQHITHLIVGVLVMCQTFSVSCKIVYRWVTTNCCFMSDIVHPQTKLKSRAHHGTMHFSPKGCPSLFRFMIAGHNISFNEAA